MPTFNQLLENALDQVGTPAYWDEIEQFTSQPMENWAKLVEVKDASSAEGQWDDPGDYPSSAGAGPLPSKRYLEEFFITVVFQIDPQFAALLDSIDAQGQGLDYSEMFEDNLTDVANGLAQEEMQGIQVAWNIQRQGNIVTYSVKDFNADAVERPERGDY